MMKSPLAGIRLVGFASVLLAVGCAETPLQPEGEPVFSTSSGAVLLECPINQTQSTSGTIGVLGGILELDGHSVVLPPGAVLLPTRISLTVPASNHLKVQFQAGGSEHFEFLEPISITISYARCTRSNIDRVTLGIWHIDDQNQLLSNKGGYDDKVARRVTATSDHFSNYAVGAN